jgi:hypothetical protein
MTESQWQTCTDPAPMLAFLRRRASERKLRLFAVACSRRMLHLVTDDFGRQAVALAERLAEGRAREPDRAALWERIQEMREDRIADREFFGATLAYAVQGGIAQAGNVLSVVTSAAKKVVTALGHEELNRVLPQSALGERATAAAESIGWSALRQRQADRASQEAKQRERQVQADLLREIFGNPFRTVAIDDACLHWNDGTVPRLARVIYDERRFETLPVLADALEDAGCSDVSLLQHCRSGAAHVRGCWAVDVLVGYV